MAWQELRVRKRADAKIARGPRKKAKFFFAPKLAEKEQPTRAFFVALTEAEIRNRRFRSLLLMLCEQHV